MKKLLQSVALLLTLSLTAQPAFAEYPCAHRACGTSGAMACCPPTTSAMSAMPPNMHCDQPRPTASSPMQCSNGNCCTVSAAVVPTVPWPRLVTPSITPLAILPAAFPIPSASRPLHTPPSARSFLPTPRYILFRDFRI